MQTYDYKGYKIYRDPMNDVFILGMLKKFSSVVDAIEFIDKKNEVK